MTKVVDDQIQALQSLLDLPQEKLEEKFEAFCRENPHAVDVEKEKYSCDLPTEEKLRIARDALVRIQNRCPDDVISEIVSDALLRTKD